MKADLSGMSPIDGTRPRHVCFITGEFPPVHGGVGDYTACLARALAEQAIHCSVVTHASVRPGVGPTPPFWPDVYPGMRGWGWRSWLSLARLLDDLRPDVVHIQFQTAAFGMHPAINTLPLALRLLADRAPVAVTFHDLKVPYLFPKAGPVRAAANGLMRASAAAVFLTNEADVAALVPRGELDLPMPWRASRGRRNVHLLPIGSNVEPTSITAADRCATRRQLGLADDELAIGHFGFINEWKGVESLVAAFQRVRSAGLPAKLVFVGGAKRPGATDSFAFADRIRRATEHPDVRRHVIWTGFADTAETSRRLASLDVCALPFTDGACYRHGSLIAAIVHGLPIVTTRPAAESADLSRHGLAPLEHARNCQLVPPGDVAALADALIELAASSEPRKRLGAAAHALAPQFAWSTIARTSTAVYERLLDRHAPVREPSPAV